MGFYGYSLCFRLSGSGYQRLYLAGTDAVRAPALDGGVQAVGPQHPAALRILTKQAPPFYKAEVLG